GVAVRHVDERDVRLTDLSDRAEDDLLARALVEEAEAGRLSVDVVDAHRLRHRLRVAAVDPGQQLIGERARGEERTHEGEAVEVERARGGPGRCGVGRDRYAIDLMEARTRQEA